MLRILPLELLLLRWTLVLPELLRLIALETRVMRAAINAKREYQGLEPLNTSEFMKLMREKREIGRAHV